MIPSQVCTDWRAFALRAKSTYFGIDLTYKGVADEMRYMNYSDAGELQSIQNLLAATPQAYKYSSQAKLLNELIQGALPYIGTVQAAIEAESVFDYAMVLFSALPEGATIAKLVKEAKAAHIAGDVATESSKLQAAIRIRENAAAGNAFEGSGLQAMGLDKNKISVPATTTSGGIITIIPDATVSGLKGTFIEFKNVVNIYDTNQFRGYAAAG